MSPNFLLTVFIGLLALNLQAQRPLNTESVYDAKKRIVQQLNANNTHCTWNFALYKEKKIDGKTGLYTHDGKEVIPPQFKEILGPPYSWFVPVKKMDSDKYSLFNLAGHQLAESAYYSVVRIPNSACAINAIDETDAACMQDAYIFSLNYLCSYYLVMDSTSQKGLLNSDHEILLPFEFSKISHAGGSRFITSGDKKTNSYDLVDVETQKTLLENVEDIKVFFINKSKPIYMGRSTYQDRAPYYAVKDSGKWQLLNPDLSAVLPKVYDEINLKDTFAIARINQLYDLYSYNGDLLVSESPQPITNVISSPKDFVYVTETVQNYTYHYTLFNSNQVELLSWENGEFLTNRREIIAYARIVVNELPGKNVLAFISFDGTKGIFLFKDLSYKIIERE